MPTFELKSPEGKTYIVNGPEGSTKDDAFRVLQGQLASGTARASGAAQTKAVEQASAPASEGFGNTLAAINRPPEDKGRSWSDIPGEALSNVVPSAKRFVGGIYDAVTSPVETAKTILDIGAGALHNAVPSKVANFIDKLDWNPEATQNAVTAANAAGGMLKDRYGSVDAIKNTLATDPVGAASDISALISGGAYIAGKVPALSGVSSALGKVSKLVNPLTLPNKAAASIAAKGMPYVGDISASLIGNLGTHTGTETIKQAYKSGREGGESARAFTDNMRGKVPFADVLNTAKQNIAEMAVQKSQAYRSGMANISRDKSVLNFDGIEKALNDSYNSITFKGRAKNTKAAEVQRSIAEVVDEWKKLDPAEYHTPEGLDSLKQLVGGIAESIPFEQKTSAMVASKVYNSIKSEIVKQAPVYADTMKAYTQATEQIREIERALSLGERASADAGMRKLQSLMRNNANTNYGNRLDLASQLEQQGGKQIMPALAGQALSSPTPRGLGTIAAGATTFGANAAGGMMAAIPTLAVQSPRLMGEAAYGVGRIANQLGRIDVPVTAGDLNLLSQAGNQVSNLRERVELQRQNKMRLSNIGSATTIDEAISAAGD